MLTTRRQFLELTSSMALMAGAMCFPKIVFASNKAQSFLVLCNTDNINSMWNTEGIAISHPGSVRFFNVADKKMQDIFLPFFGHTVTQNPQWPSHLVTFEKWAKRGVLINAQTMAIVTVAEPLEGNVFFGHAAYTPDGEFLINTEETYARDGGQLVVRDPLTLKPIKTVPSYGLRPHECVMLKDGRTLLVMNEGLDAGDSVLAWVDMPTGKLQHKVELKPFISERFSTLANNGCSHVVSTFDGWAICGGGVYLESDDQSKPSSRHAIIAFVSPAGDVYGAELPATLTSDMRGETLSLCALGKSGLVAVTVSSGNMCLIFDYKTQKLVRVIKGHKALGVASLPPTLPNQERFMISSQHGMLEVKCGPDGQDDISFFNATLGGAGSHLNLISL
jgi:hypothetical protein